MAPLSRVVFLLDVDHTLLDNVRVAAHEVGATAQKAKSQMPAPCGPRRKERNANGVPAN